MKLLLLLLFLSSHGTFPSEYRIPYRELSWSDFRGKIPKDKPTVAAFTTCQMVMDYMRDGGKYRYVVSAYFLPDSSYVRLKTDEVLRHEQTHFKISYIMALKCMRDLAPLQGVDIAPEKEADKIFQKYIQERNSLNQRLDAYTDNALDEVAEQNWEYQISAELSNLESQIKAINGRNR